MSVSQPSLVVVRVQGRSEVPGVTVLVAAGASQFGFLDEGVSADIEVGDVVVLEERRRTAVDALAIPLLDDPLLPICVSTVLP